MENSIKPIDLIIICGPPASGKMTIGQALMKRTDYKLFHNHMSLELVNQFFDWGTQAFRALDKTIRFSIFREVAKSDLTGLIFTMVWAFDDDRDLAYIQEIIEIFKVRQTRLFIFELECSLEERLRRNKTPNRLAHKPSKRNLDFSDKLVVSAEEECRMNTLENEFPDLPIIKIQNTQLSAEAVADLIMDHLS